MSESFDEAEIRARAEKAVAELHRPSPPYLLDVPEICEHCSDNEDEREVAYPCPTIRAASPHLTAEDVQRVLREAWDEGWRAGAGWPQDERNPYAEEAVHE